MTHIGLFEGIGGFSLAAKWMGWQTVAWCEINAFAQKVLRRHYPQAEGLGDITKTDFTKYKGKIDILTGGFPCQDISYAKSWTTNGAFQENGISGKRSGLWTEYARAIDEIKPKYVVAENVAALTNQGLDIVLRTLAELGYDAEWYVIPAAFVGAPHLRKRVWIVAYARSIGRNQESIIFSKIFSQKVQQAPEWEFSRTICQTNGKKTLPQSFGIYDGIPKELHHTDRITALGNSLVPQVAHLIFKSIQENENLNT